jgi:xanthine dehydrogenase accessory factor
VLRLHRAGLRVVVCELPEPLAVRRLVSFAEAINLGRWSVEGVEARKVDHPENILEIHELLSHAAVPVIVDSNGDAVRTLNASIVVDGRMKKQQLVSSPHSNGMLIGLGPGFTAGVNCDAVIETNRGHYLGRVLWSGSAQADTGIPEGVVGYRRERVLRASQDGILQTAVAIGDHVEQGALVAEIVASGGTEISARIEAPFPGVVRGLLRSGTAVVQKLKVGDIDPRDEPAFCASVSDKALAVGGGVLEAILSQPELRSRLWNLEHS